MREESFNTYSPTYETSSALNNRLAGLRLQPIVPSVETTEPSVQVIEPSVQATEPSVQATEPSVQATETTRTSVQTSVQGNGLKIYKNITKIMHYAYICRTELR